MSLNLLVAISLICWSLWGICDKKALQRSAPAATLLMTYGLYVPAALVTAAIVTLVQPGWHLSQGVLFWTGLTALANWLGVVAYLKAMTMAEASYVLGITSGYPVIMQIIAVFALGEKIVPLRVVGSLLIFCGVFTIGANRGAADSAVQDSPENAPLEKSVGTRREKMQLAALMVVAMLGWGSMGIFDKLGVEIAKPLEVVMGAMLWNCVFAFLSWPIALARGAAPKSLDFDLWKFPALSTLCLSIGGISYIGAISMTSATYVIVITGCYPLLMYGFAVWLLGEKVNRARLAGIAVLVAGGILTQLTQSM